MKTVVARYRWTYEKAELARHLYHRTQRREKILSWIIITAALLLIAGAAGWEKSFSSTMVVLAIVVFVGGFAMFITYFFISPRLRRWQFDNLGIEGVEFTWTFTPENVTCANKDGSFTTPWTSLKKVSSTIYGFLLFWNPKTCYFIPLDAFENPENIAEFRELVTHNGFALDDLK